MFTKNTKASEPLPAPNTHFASQLAFPVELMQQACVYEPLFGMWLLFLLKEKHPPIYVLYLFIYLHKMRIVF